MNPPDPIGVHLFGTYADVQIMDAFPDLIQQPRRMQRRQRNDWPGAIEWSTGFHDLLILFCYSAYDSKCRSAMGFQLIIAAGLWRTRPCYAEDLRPTFVRSRVLG